MQAVRGDGGGFGVRRPPECGEVALGSSVCSAQCTVIRTQQPAAQADPAWSDAAPRGKHLPAAR